MNQIGKRNLGIKLELADMKHVDLLDKDDDERPGLIDRNDPGQAYSLNQDSGGSVEDN